MRGLLNEKPRRVAAGELISMSGAGWLAGRRTDRMPKEKTLAGNSFFRELFHIGLYKSSQGRLTRRVTFLVIAMAFGLAAWQLSPTLERILDWWARLDSVKDRAWIFPRWCLDLWLHHWSSAAFCIVGLWIGYRLVNLPRFADFLIAVEAEMNKVSWPTRTELIRNSIVVVFVIFSMAFLLFLFDLIWRAVFLSLEVIQSGGSP